MSGNQLLKNLSCKHLPREIYYSAIESFSYKICRWLQLVQVQITDRSTSEVIRKKHHCVTLQTSVLHLHTCPSFRALVFVQQCIYLLVCTYIIYLVYIKNLKSNTHYCFCCTPSHTVLYINLLNCWYCVMPVCAYMYDQFDVNCFSNHFWPDYCLWIFF